MLTNILDDFIKREVKQALYQREYYLERLLIDYLNELTYEVTGDSSILFDNLERSEKIEIKLRLKDLLDSGGVSKKDIELVKEKMLEFDSKRNKPAFPVEDNVKIPG